MIERAIVELLRILQEGDDESRFRAALVVLDRVT